MTGDDHAGRRLHILRRIPRLICVTPYAGLTISYFIYIAASALGTSQRSAGLPIKNPCT